MAQQTRKWNPGDAANVFVRVILSDAGALLGGLTDEEWQETLDWFDRRCAYTNEELPEDRAEQDHAIPMNRKHCGLHLYGNVLPATREANRRKAGKHYRNFVDHPDRLDRIETFVRESGYWDKVSVFGDLQHYCEAQYRSIDALFPRQPPVPRESDARSTGRGRRIRPGACATDSAIQVKRGDAADHLGSSVAGCVPGCVAARAAGMDRRDPPRWQEGRAALGRTEYVAVVERHRQPAKSPAIPEECMEATRHPIARRFHQTTLKALTIVIEPDPCTRGPCEPTASADAAETARSRSMAGKHSAPPFGLDSLRH